MILDKTGTLTSGRPEIERDRSPSTASTRTRCCGWPPRSTRSRRTRSPRRSSRGARRRGLALSFPEDVEEGAGQGAEGVVDGRRVAVGSEAWLERRGYPIVAAAASRRSTAPTARAREGPRRRRRPSRRRDRDGRPPAPRRRRPRRGLRAAGIRHVAMATGDRAAVAEEIGREVGVDRVLRRAVARGEAGARPLDPGGRRPAAGRHGRRRRQRRAGARARRRRRRDGHGRRRRSPPEAADAVILVDRIGRVADAIRIGRRSLRIARQSVLAGIGLSLVAMAFAAVRLHPAGRTAPCSRRGSTSR